MASLGHSLARLRISVNSFGRDPTVRPYRDFNSTERYSRRKGRVLVPANVSIIVDARALNRPPYVRPCRESHSRPIILMPDFMMPLNNLMVVPCRFPLPSSPLLELDGLPSFLGFRSFAEKLPGVVNPPPVIPT